MAGLGILLVMSRINQMRIDLLVIGMTFFAMKF